MFPRDRTRVKVGILSTVRFCLGLLTANPWGLALAAICIHLQVAYNLLIPMANRHILDVAVPQEDLVLAVIVLAVMAAALVLRVSVMLVQERVTATLASEASTGVRRKLLAWVHQRELAIAGSWDDEDVATRVTVDVAEVERVVVELLPRTAFLLLNIVACVGLMAWVEWRLAVVTVLVLALVLNFPRWMARRAAQASMLRKDAEADVLSATRESLRLRALVLSFGLATWREDQAAEPLDQFRSRARDSAFFGSLVRGLTGASLGVVLIAVLGVGAVLVVEGALSVGSLLAFVLLVNTVSGSSFGLASCIPPLIASAAAIARVRELLDTPADADVGEDVGPMVTGITLSNVSFGYPSGPLVLRDLSLSIKAGTSVAFVGPSGSGKSTVLKMLTREFDPTHGEVRWDGVAMDHATRASLRQHTGVVAQDSRLFDTTIRANIRAGRLNATDDEIVDAAKLAELHALVQAMPDGYDTQVGPGGGHLSGGQRQRVCIARALVRSPSLLVLDEATSALDPATEHAIDQTLERVRQGRTVVSVTHRLAGSRSCDQIFVMDQGTLVESGTHETLRAKQGLYARLWRVQSGLDDGEGRVTVSSEALAALPLFEGVAPERLEEVSERLVTVHVREGDAVFRQGDYADALYLSVRGRLQVEVPGPDGPRILRAVGIGEFFGELGLLHDVRRTATVRAGTDAVMVALFRSSLEALVAEEPGVYDRIAQAAAARAPTVGLTASAPGDWRDRTV